jgi:hypothetical protein
MTGATRAASANAEALNAEALNAEALNAEALNADVLNVEVLVAHNPVPGAGLTCRPCLRPSAEIVTTG